MGSIMSKLLDLEKEEERKKKMNIVVHMTECRPNSTVASARVARFISTKLGLLLVDTKQKAYELRGCNIGKLIIVNGPMAFCDFLPELSDLVRATKRNDGRVIWVQQDYTIMPPSATSKAESPFRRVFAELGLRPDFWTTCENNILRPGDRYINWNQLTYDQQPFRMMNKNSVLYYGAYREKREESFKRFLYGLNCPITISTTTRRMKKFQELGIGASFVPTFDDVIKDACHFDAALYIEDDKSHTQFHSPANRFYEMLSAGVPMFFDYKAVPMLEKAGIIVPAKWTVEDNFDLGKKYVSTDLVTMRQEQRNMWSKDYVGELTERLKEIWNEL